jgi:hypothetical protein
VHVCQRWRYLIFEWSIRLNLQLFCKEKSPVKEMLDVWPPIPLAIQVDCSNSSIWSESNDWRRSLLDNLIPALERRDRVHRIDIANPTECSWEEIVTAMQGPYPALRYFSLESLEEVPPLPLPDTFLNGYAPCLQYFALGQVSFPSLPRFLSYTKDLTSLHLSCIVYPGYIPPETMATCLSALPKLKSLEISFCGNPEMPTPHPQGGNQASLPPTRFVLSALTELDFGGVNKYMEALAARIDAPLLDEFHINFDDEFVFNIPQTIRFFCHLDSFRPSGLTLIFRRHRGANIYFPSHHSSYPPSWHIMCQQLDRQVIYVARICSQILPFHSNVDSLKIEYRDEDSLNLFRTIRQDEIDRTLWSQLFHTFTSVHSLSIPATLQLSIVAALQGPTGESTAEVFPLLRNLSIVGYVWDNTARQGIQSFIAARQRSGRPVAVTVSHS